MPWSHDDLPVAFTLSQAESAGVSRHRLNRAGRSGQLWRPTPGVYVDTAGLQQLSWHERHTVLARVAALHVPDSVVSHVSAALLMGLPNPPRQQGPVRLTVASRPRVNRPSDWVHLHRARLPARHVATFNGIRVTTPARTVVDCCRELRAGDAVAVADAALRSGLVTEDELLAMFRFQHRWPGSGGTRRALPLLDPRRENWFESFSATALHEHGVPLAVPQVNVYSPAGGFLGRVDFLWEGDGVIGEADGVGKLLGEFSPDEDGRTVDEVSRRVVALGERSTRLRELGFEIFHWNPTEMLTDPWPIALRYFDAVRRARPERITAVLRCVCCAGDLKDCRWRDRLYLPPPTTMYARRARTA
jgi:hypothetical protein